MSNWHINPRSKRLKASPIRRCLPDQKDQEKVSRRSRSRSKEKDQSVSKYREAQKEQTNMKRSVGRLDKSDEYEMIRLHNELFMPKKKPNPMLLKEHEEWERLMSNNNDKRSPIKENHMKIIDKEQENSEETQQMIQNENNKGKLSPSSKLMTSENGVMSSLAKGIDDLLTEEGYSNGTHSTNFTPDKDKCRNYVQNSFNNLTNNQSDKDDVNFGKTNRRSPYKTLDYSEMDPIPERVSISNETSQSGEMIVEIPENESLEEDSYELEIVIECFDESQENSVIFEEIPKQEEIIHQDKDKNLEETINPKIRDQEAMEIEYEPIVEISNSISAMSEQLSIKDPIIDITPKPIENGKLNLVLDLDETLINTYTASKLDKFRGLNLKTQSKVQEFTCNDYCIKMITRPYLNEFLERVSKHYNIFLYSFGRYKYVCCALDLIDKEEKYIKRERVFGSKPNEKRVQKQLSNLNLNEREKERTLIIDDLCNIWLEDEKVICSKKFIPFKDYLNKDLYNNFPIFVTKGSGEEKSSKEVKWLTHNNKISDLKYYSESGNKKPFQLEALADFLETLAEQYQQNCCISTTMALSKFFHDTRKELLKGLRIKILSGSTQRQKTFEEIADLLGAEHVDAVNAEYILVDSYLDPTARTKLQEDLVINKKIKILSIYWLVECFFLLKKVRLQDFYANSSLKVSYS